MTKQWWLWGILLVCQTSWAQLQGMVLDPQGAPVRGAVVDLVGANISQAVNEQGEFHIPGLSATHLELHVRAPGFMHRTFHLHHMTGEPLQLVIHPTVIEVVNVVGLPWHASNMESAQPINVLAGEGLRSRQAVTLGDTLKYEVGIHSSYYGPVASSPIIRGLDGPRVLIAQNGLDAGDASRVGPDHAVATEATTARQIEVLRGPATLFYGSGAIGGVVNIVDDRVPQSADTRGEWRLQYSDIASDKLVSGSVTTGHDSLAVHLDGFLRDSGDYTLPGGGELDNSATQAQGLNLGGSYLVDQGFIGLSFGRLEREYGIPGHSHGHESEGDELNVYADLVQDRVQLISELTLDNHYFSALNTRLGYTDYVHHEMENGEALTSFRNRTREARVDLFHHPLAEWRGALSLHYKHSDFVADGAEAFTPPSTTESLALALMEERHLGDLLLQLGARVERVNITAEALTAELGDAEYPHHTVLRVFSVDHESTPFSASAGVVWDFTQGYNLGLSLTHAQRTPSAAEVLSFGPHIGSGLFEVGALMSVVPEDEGHVHFDLARRDLALEKSNNLDISLRKYEGDLAFIVNAFFNRIDNYYYLRNTGLVYADDDHGNHDHGHNHNHDHGELPIYVYEAQDAELYGLEGQVVWQAADTLKFTFSGDAIRARRTEGGNLPRIPPLRVGSLVNYDLGAFGLEFSAQHYFRQDHIAAYETETAGYTLVDLQASYQIDGLFPGARIYVQGKNLTDKTARVHSSFLKHLAPLPGRSLVIGISGTF